MQIILVLENRKSDDHKSMRKVFHLITKLKYMGQRLKAL